MHNDGDNGMTNANLVRSKKIKLKFFFKAHIMTTISELKEEIDHLNSKHEGITKFVCMMNSKTETLSKILGVGKMSKQMKGIGCNHESSNSKNMFVPLFKKTEFIMPDYKSQHPFKHRNQYSNTYASLLGFPLLWLPGSYTTLFLQIIR